MCTTNISVYFGEYTLYKTSSQILFDLRYSSWAKFSFHRYAFQLYLMLNAGSLMLPNWYWYIRHRRATDISKDSLCVCLLWQAHVLAGHCIQNLSLKGGCPRNIWGVIWSQNLKQPNIKCALMPIIYWENMLYEIHAVIWYNYCLISKSKCKCRHCHVVLASPYQSIHKSSICLVAPFTNMF